MNLLGEMATSPGGCMSVAKGFNPLDLSSYPFNLARRANEKRCKIHSQIKRPLRYQPAMNSPPTNTPPFILGLWGVRYQVQDVQRSIAFYTQKLGFHLDMQHLPAFGQVSIGDLKLILSGPGASGSRPLPDGRQQQPGGWNRVVLHVQDLPTRIVQLETLGVRFRNELQPGPGGQQVQIEDPDGNPIELFEPASR